MHIINIRTQPHHIPEVAGWLFAEWGHLTPGSSVERSIQRLTERCQTDDLPVTFIAIEENDVVGTVSLVPHDLKIRMDLTPWIASVFVKPGSRGRGVGSQLVSFAEAEAQRRDISAMYLFTPNKQQMYARLGWNTVEEVEYRGEHVTVMNKTFPPELNSAV
jgi:predicted N-acetyltransferase YhbS